MSTGSDTEARAGPVFLIMEILPANPIFLNQVLSQHKLMHSMAKAFPADARWKMWPRWGGQPPKSTDNPNHCTHPSQHPGDPTRHCAWMCQEYQQCLHPHSPSLKLQKFGGTKGEEGRRRGKKKRKEEIKSQASLQTVNTHPE